MGAYPLLCEADNGYRFEAKSNAEDIEKVRPCPTGRPEAAGFRSSRGSSSSSEILREDVMPDLEEDEDEDVRGPGELDARLASSKESRACGCRPEYVGMVVSMPAPPRGYGFGFQGLLCYLGAEIMAVIRLFQDRPIVYNSVEC